MFERFGPQFDALENGTTFKRWDLVCVCGGVLSEGVVALLSLLSFLKVSPGLLEKLQVEVVY